MAAVLYLLETRSKDRYCQPEKTNHHNLSIPRIGRTGWCFLREVWGSKCFEEDEVNWARLTGGEMPEKSVTMVICCAPG